MAFQKTIQIGNGFDATYWRLGIIHVDIYQETAWCHMHGYKDLQAATAKLQPAMVIEEHLPFVPDATRTQLYNYLKNNVERWADSVDV